MCFIFFRGVVKDKIKDVADVAQDKEEEVKEAGALDKKSPSTILKDTTGEKPEIAEEVAEKKLEVAKDALEELKLEKKVQVERRRWYQPPLQQ